MARRGGVALDNWSGLSAKARAIVVTWLPMPCGRCGRVLDGTQPWNVGHKKSRISFPHLIAEPSNWQPECKSCSDKSAQAAVIEKAKRDALIERGIDPDDGFLAEGPRFSRRPSSRTHTEPSGVRSELTWTEFSREAPEWLTDVLVIPEDASPPLATTPVHPRATGTYGPEACEWIERELRQELPRGLRWWQRFAVYRALEHDEEGRLIWTTVLETAPRRSGKSVRLRAMALWRVAHPELFDGEAQLVIHTGRDVAVVREIHRKAWRWAEERKDQGWEVKKGVGQEEVVSEGAHRWIVRSVNSVYGYDATNPYIDEAWDVEPTVFTEGLEPATLERVSPQSVLTSTAHRRATSLMKTRIAGALALEDGKTLLMMWAAPEGSDVGDPDVWRAASPYWSQARADLLAAKHVQALAGEQDPEFDDPDPMAGFTSQYLNQWQLKPGKRRAPGNQVVTEDAWGALAAQVPEGPPAAVAVEGWFQEGLSVARGWMVDGQVIVSVTEHRDAASAAAAVRAADCPNPAQVGKSLLLAEPAFRDVFAEAAQGTTRSAVQELSRLIGEGAIRHVPGDELTRQVLELRTQPGADGVRVTSKNRCDGPKALVWCVTAARTAPEPSMVF